MGMTVYLMVRLLKLNPLKKEEEGDLKGLKIMVQKEQKHKDDNQKEVDLQLEGLVDLIRYGQNYQDVQSKELQKFFCKVILLKNFFLQQEKLQKMKENMSCILHYL